MATPVQNEPYDVAVIGAGVFGAWTALTLRRSGYSVLLVDAYGVGNSRSSSGGESRIIRMGYGDDEIYTRSAIRSLVQWRELSAKCDEPIFYPTGVLWLASKTDSYAVKCAATLERVGVAIEKLDSRQLASRYSQLMTTDIEWALLERDSGALMARRGVQAVVRSAINKGVDYRVDRIHTPTSIPPVTESGERIAAARYVFACGPWLPELFPEILRDRINPTRQEVIFFGAQQNARDYSPSSLPIWVDFDNEAYGFPDLENRGVKVAIDRHGPSFDPDLGDRVVTSEGLNEARAYLAHRVPRLRGAPVVEARVCQYENTSNGDFLIDRHPDHEGVWLVGGGSGHGFKHGPAIGEYMLGRLSGDEEAIEPRFSLATKLTTQRREVF